MRLPGGAATGPGDEALAVEDLEYAGHAPHLALEVPRVVGQCGGGGAAAAHPRGHVSTFAFRGWAQAKAVVCLSARSIRRGTTACAQDDRPVASRRARPVQQPEPGARPPMLRTRGLVRGRGSGGSGRRSGRSELKRKAACEVEEDEPTR